MTKLLACVILLAAPPVYAAQSGCVGECTNGTGTYHFSNGDRYEGEWKDGKRDGRGTRYFSNGDRYEGEWKDSYRNGQGTYYFSNGDRYEGEWKDGKRDGQGTYYFSNGDRYEGEWKDGKLHGQRTWYFSNGDRYEGEWKDGKLHGQKTWYFADGDHYKGEWVDGERTKVEVCVLSVCFAVVPWIYDVIEEYWWIFLLLLIPIGIYLGRLSADLREHKRAMGPAAARLGLVFQEKDPGLPFRAFSLLSRSGGRIRNVSKGEVGGSEMVLLDYTYTESVWDEGGERITQTVGAVRVAGLKLPAFLLEALKLPAFMLLPKRTSVKGIKFDSHPQFSKKYRLTGADETAIRQLFGSYILEFFQQSRGEYVEWLVECDGQWMVIWHSVVGVDRFAIREDIKRLSGGKPDANFAVNFQEAVMRKYVEETMRIVDVFRHST